MSALSHSFLIADFFLSDSERGLFHQLVDAGMIAPSSEGKFRLTRVGVKVANSALRDFIIPAEELLVGGFELEPRYIESRRLALEAAEKLKTKEQELLRRTFEVEKERAVLLAQTEKLTMGVLRMPGAKVSPLSQFVKDKLSLLRGQPDFERLSKKEGISELVLAHVLGLHAAIERERPDFEVFIVTNPSHTRSSRDRSGDDDLRPERGNLERVDAE